jgi:hypothetical protein
LVRFGPVVYLEDHRLFLMQKKKSYADRRAAFVADQERFQERLEEDRARKSIHAGLAEVVRIERYEAAQRQKRVGIETPARTDFVTNPDPEKEEAMDRIWEAGPKGKRLYIKIAKGLATLTWPDVIKLSGRADIEALADRLADGLTLKEVISRKATLFTSLQE